MGNVVQAMNVSNPVKQMINDIIRREGGYVNHANDRGGPTNYGITQKTLSRYFRRSATISEVKHMRRDLAEEIYERNYYHKPQLYKLPEQIQAFIFDCAANHGPNRAIKFVQSVCSSAGNIIAVDGLMGPATAMAAQWCQDNMQRIFFDALIIERKKYYYAIVRRDSSQSVFLDGWLNRVKKFEVA